MKTENGFRRKLRYGSVSVGIVAVVIAASILINLLVSFLCFGNLWITDLTEHGLYTFSDGAEHLLGVTLESANERRSENDPVKVTITFCADRDMLLASDELRYAYYTALSMQKAFPDSIEVVDDVNVWTNPSEVDAYRANSYSSIYQSNVIVSSGSEFRVLTSNLFFQEGATIMDARSYCGERVLIRSIIAVTRAEMPIACLTVNHGEALATPEGKAEYSEFLRVVENAGFRVQDLDLSKEDIPADCRLIITFDPQKDFLSSFETADGSSELKKLETFLKDQRSFMVFTDADTPELYDLEEFLEEWGISYGRYEEKDEGGNVVASGSYEVLDGERAVDGTGKIFYAEYGKGGVAGSSLEDVRTAGGEPKVLFGNATGIFYSPTYQKNYQIADETKGITEPFEYGRYYRNGQERMIYDLFTAGERALCYAKANGAWLLDGEGTPVIVDTAGGYRLMTLTRQTEAVGEGTGWTNVYESSYVCAVGSVEFASNEVLASASYGNTDVLLSVLREIGKEIDPVGIESKYMALDTLGLYYDTSSDAAVATVLLMAIPAVACAVCGTVILIRRRTRA